VSVLTEELIASLPRWKRFGPGKPLGRGVLA